MYLNVFEKEQVIEVVRLLKGIDNNDLIFKDNTLGMNLAKELYLKLSYFPAMHRIDIDLLKLDKPLYSNPDCISSLYPKNKFISVVIGSKFNF